MHSTSVHLGTAADSVAQADYDMASLPVVRRDTTLVKVRGATRRGVSIGQGAFARRRIEPGTIVLGFREGAYMPLKEWDAYCEARGLPAEWAGVRSYRTQPAPGKAKAAVMLFDRRWTSMSNRPQWSYMNHDRSPNTAMELRPGGRDDVVWRATRPIEAGEEITYLYGDANEDLETQEVGAAPREARAAARDGTRSPTDGRQHPTRGAASDTPLDQEVIKHLGFVPAWASAPAAAVEAQPSTARESANAFRPAWARSPNQLGPTRVTPTEARQARRGASHPYAQPAYGTSKLRSDQLEIATALAKRLARDRSSGRIMATEAELLDMATAVAEARADGINPRTASKDAFALREFEAFAQVRGFDPNLRSEWARKFPERESLKMASWLLWRAQRAVPRAKKDRGKAAKPMSIYQNYLALRRVFKSRDVELTPPHTVRETLRGLIRRFIRRFGIDSLRPKRVEPITPSIVLKNVERAEKGGETINGTTWSLANWTCFIITAWMVINLSVGSRKGESTKLQGDVDENDHFNRASVTYCIGGRTHVDPPEAELRAMAEGDNAALAPRGSKCDQWGTCHGTEPIILPYHDQPDNAARWLRDIELRAPCHGPENRRKMPLFANESQQPFNDDTFARYVNAAIAAVVGRKRAELYSCHSWRVWLASSLRMCGASDARIQAMGRWLSPHSLKLYARITKQEYATWVDRMMQVQRIDTARTTNLPVIDAADALSIYGDQLTDDGPRPNRWREPEATTAIEPAPLKRGERLSVYWTEMDEWYEGTCMTHRVEDADGGGKQRSTCILYDAVGAWAQCTKTQLTYWHCLEDEQWEAAA